MPASILEQLYDFFSCRRRVGDSSRGCWPASSFRAEITKEERRYLGDPLSGPGDPRETLEDWVEHLVLGGGRAARAVPLLAGTKSRETTRQVIRVLRSRRLGPDARTYAARALGLLGGAGSRAALRGALTEPATRIQSGLTIECARALALLEDPDAGPALGKAVHLWLGYLQSKVDGGQVWDCDWLRAASTVQALLEAWSTVVETPDPGFLDRTIVRRVLAGSGHLRSYVRIPAPVSPTRTALAGGVARIYKTCGAPEGMWSRLEAAVKTDPDALASIAEAR